MTAYPALENFLAAYFHQDWAMDHAGPDAVVDDYRSSESPQQLAATHDDIVRLLAATSNDAELADMARAIGCEYDPTREGRSWRDWLASIAARFGDA